MERHDLDLGPAIEAWLADLTLSDASPRTVATYRSLTRCLLSFATVNAITDQDCRRIVLRVRDRSANSAATTYAAIAGFFRWCKDQGLVQTSPMERLPKPRKRIPPHRFLTVEQCARVYACCKTDEDRLTIRLLACGLRANELLSATWGAYDADSGILRLTVTKGRKPRPVPLDAPTCALLDARPRTGERIFPFTGTTLRNRIAQLGRDAGIGHITPHVFRHTWASQFMLAGGDGQALQTLGGWARPDMVRRYAQSALEDAAINAARKADLGSRLFGD